MSTEERRSRPVGASASRAAPVAHRRTTARRPRECQKGRRGSARRPSSDAAPNCLTPTPGPATTAAVIHTLRLLARRIGQLTTEARDLQQRMTRVISAAHTPQLLDQLGVGPDNAAALLITAGDNPAAARGRGKPRPR